MEKRQNKEDLKRLFDSKVFDKTLCLVKDLKKIEGIEDTKASVEDYKGVSITTFKLYFDENSFNGEHIGNETEVLSERLQFYFERYSFKVHSAKVTSECVILVTTL